MNKLGAPIFRFWSFVEGLRCAELIGSDVFGELMSVGSEGDEKPGKCHQRRSNDHSDAPQSQLPLRLRPKAQLGDVLGKGWDGRERSWVAGTGGWGWKLVEEAGIVAEIELDALFDGEGDEADGEGGEIEEDRSAAGLQGRGSAEEAREIMADVVAIQGGQGDDAGDDKEDGVGRKRERRQQLHLTRPRRHCPQHKQRLEHAEPRQQTWTGPPKRSSSPNCFIKGCQP